MQEYIKIRGARENNLKNISLNIPKNKMVVITGVSGSGKSSLAFDTIYSEGQRRYVESLSAYARQFISQVKKPELDSIEGLSPAISIEQKSVSKNPRSTVATMTEIYDYMRLLWANIGVVHCPVCKNRVKKSSLTEIKNEILLKTKENDKLVIMSKIAKDKKGAFKNVFTNLKKQGFQRVLVDNLVLDLDEEIELDKNKRHDIFVIIDRILLKKENDEQLSRIADSIEIASKLADGNIAVEINKEIFEYSERYICINHEDINFPEISSRLFSFNAPFGACITCNGLGSSMEVDAKKLVIDEDKPISDGGVYVSGGSSKNSWTYHLFLSFLKANNIDKDKTYKQLSKKEKEILMYGNTNKFIFEIDTKEYKFNGYKVFEGIYGLVKKRYAQREMFSETILDEIESKYMTEKICTTCNGDRLNEIVLNITIQGKNIIDVTKMNIQKSYEFFDNLNLSDKEMHIAKEILKEIKERITFMINVGLDYLSLSRATKTLSGGESQRIRLATQIGSKLTGVIYVLDEPSIGLHQRDNDRLLNTLKELKEIGNTLIVVEHDEDTMKEADYLIDIGKEAGIYGGNIVAMGTPLEVMENNDSLTGKYLKGTEKIEIPKKRRKSNNFLELKSCSGNNLKNVNLKIPKGVFTCISGVSGSGKSSLINSTLYPALMEKVYKSKTYPLKYKSISNYEDIKKVIDIDQSPIGRTPRSNTSTYTGVFDDIREIFAETKDSKMRGYKKGRFSFNIKGGRCETCSGAGIIKIEMNFLPDVYVNCDICKGKRYNKETLEVKYKGYDISEVLNMSVLEAYSFFEKIPNINRKLKTLIDVGMGYISLGQSSTTLSGGEAQRIKLASELSKTNSGESIYILDEPTTGLHFEDVKKLLSVLNSLVDKGNTVLVIEHNLDVIKSADYIIDMGPEGGDKGGQIIAQGSPENICNNNLSHTARYLRKILGDNNGKI